MNTNHFSIVDHRLAKMIGISLLAALMIAIATKVYAAGATATGSPPPIAPGDEELYSSGMASPGLIAGPWNSMIWGPDICAGYGDPGVPSSPWADNVGGKYTYRIAVPNSYTEDLLRVELFDPDTGNPLEHYQSPDRYTVYNPDGTSQLHACNTSLGRKDTCSLFTSASSLPDWQVRLDENRGNGVPGQCSPGETYNGAFNTTTLFRLYYYEEQPESGVQEVDLAYYVGKRDDPSQPPATQAEAVATDLQWVSPGVPSGQQMPAFDLAYVQADPVLGQLGWNSSGDVVCTQAGHCVLPSAAEPPTTTENCDTYRQSNPTYTAAQRCQGNGDFVIDLTNELSGIATHADGTKSLYLDVRTLSGASENGYEVWAGPQRSAPSAVNSRNLLVKLAEAELVENPREMEGVQIYAERYLPVNVLTGNPSTLALTHLEPEDGGRQIPLTAFDVEYGAEPPIYFYLDTVPKADWAACYADNPAQCTAAGLSAASYQGSAQFVHYTWAEYQFTLPDTINGNPFPGGNLLVSFQSGITDSQTWQLGFMPASPTLLSPSDGSSTADSTPDFDWSDVTGATQYQIQVADYSIGFSNPVIDAVTTDSVYTPTTALADGAYTWRVQTFDGDWGDYSGAWTVTIGTPLAAPTLISPPDGSTVDDSSPTLDWDDVAGATSYQIEIDDNADFSGVSGTTTTSVSTYTPLGLVNGTYYWRVRASNGVWSDYSDTWTVTVDAEPIAVPILTSPADGSTTDDYTPTFDWEDVTEALAYNIQIDDNADFASPTSFATANSTYTPSALVNGTYYWHVRASNGLWGDYSNAWTVTVDAELPAIPILTSPADGSDTGNDNTPTFDWGDVAGATRYQIQVDDNTDFSSPVINVTPTTSSYTPASALVNGTYTWRVRASNGLWGDYSDAWTVIIDAEPPAIPSLTSPANGSTIDVNTPTFDWEDVAGVTQYQIQADDNVDFSSLVVDRLTADSVYTRTSALPNGTYYWRVRASNDAWSNYSGAWTVTIRAIPAVPTLVSPANGSTTTDSTPTLHWNIIAVATQYQIQVDDNADFSSPAIYTSTGSSYTLASALANGTCYWRVRASNGLWSDYSGAWMLTIAAPPAVPALIAPASGTFTTDSTPTFVWSEVTGATQYQIQVADYSLGFTSPIIDVTLTTSTYTSTVELTNDTYSWRVRASNGNWSGYTGSWLLSVAVPPTLIAPADGSTIDDNTPTFDWEDVTGATYYGIEVDDNADFSSPVIHTNITTSVYTRLSEMLNGTYYWHVKSTSNVASVYGSAWTVTIAAIPPVPSLWTPTNGSFTDDTTPTFDWTGVSTATQYQIQVDDNADFSSPEVDALSTTSDYTPTLELALGVYSWRVRTGNGLWSDYSEARTLTITLPPAMPILITPANGALIIDDTTPTFDWDEVTGATQYQMQVDDNADFSSPVIYIATVNSTYTPSSVLANGTYAWRVRASNGVWGAYSSAWTVTVAVPPGIPNLLSPDNGSVTADNTPMFTWFGVTAGTTQYQIQVDDNADFSSPALDTTMATSDYTPVSALAIGTYSWRVRAYNGVWGAYSSPRTVTIVLPPGIPVLVSPANGSTTNASIPTFDWNDVTGATKYQLQVDDNADFSSSVICTPTTTSSCGVGLVNGVYYWRVRAYTVLWGVYSSAWTVTVAAPPAKPTLASPANGSVTGDSTPDFDWNNVTGATQYQIQVDDNADFSSPAIDTTTTTSVYTSTSALAIGVYSWHVRAFNGVWGGYSSTRMLTIAVPPAAPVLISPDNDSTMDDNTPIFDWEDAPGSTQYQIQVDNNADFSSPVISTNTSASAYTPSTALANSVYSWRVRAYNGLWGGYSSVWTLTVDAPPTPTPSGTNIIANPGFENGITPWALDGFVDTTRPHNGAYSARLCGGNSCSDSVAQQITVPASGVLTYWWYMTTSEGTGTAYDYLRVRLYTTGGSLIVTLRTWSNTSTRNMWSQDTISLSSYAGQTVVLNFASTTDSSLSSTFFVDDVEVR